MHWELGLDGNHTEVNRGFYVQRSILNCYTSSSRTHILKCVYAGTVPTPVPPFPIRSPPQSRCGLVQGKSRSGGLYVRTWNLPAFVMYLMPLKGLYFSPYMSSRFTFSPVGGQKKNTNNFSIPAAWCALNACYRTRTSTGTNMKWNGGWLIDVSIMFLHHFTPCPLSN